MLRTKIPVRMLRTTQCSELLNAQNYQKDGYSEQTKLESKQIIQRKEVSQPASQPVRLWKAWTEHAQNSATSRTNNATTIQRKGVEPASQAGWRQGLVWGAYLPPAAATPQQPNSLLKFIPPALYSKGIPPKTKLSIIHIPRPSTASHDC